MISSDEKDGLIYSNIAVVMNYIELHEKTNLWK